jgi:hypothetical protein
MRTLLLVLLFAGCIVQAQNAINPPATGGGTLTCRQIAEQCDSQCEGRIDLPICVRNCGNQGTPDAAAIHNTLVDCAQRNNCFDQACLEGRCGGEIQACMGPDQAQQPADQPAPSNEPTGSSGS